MVCPWFTMNFPMKIMKNMIPGPAEIFVGPCKQWSRIHDRWAMELLVIKRVITPSNFTNIVWRKIRWNWTHDVGILPHPREVIYYLICNYNFSPPGIRVFHDFVLLKCPFIDTFPMENLQLSMDFPWFSHPKYQFFSAFQREHVTISPRTSLPGWGPPVDCSRSKTTTARAARAAPGAAIEATGP